MIVKALGPGCTKLERSTREAFDRLGLDATVEKVEDHPAIVGYGIRRSTPGLVIDDKVLLSGRVSKSAEIQEPPTAASSS